MDEPAQLVPEWRRKNVLPALRDLYDEIWVYGLPQICNPLEGLTLPASVRRKTAFTGYLRRELPTGHPAPDLEPFLQEPYILVTAGGGGAAEEIVDWVLRAFEADDDLTHRALIDFGPLMPIAKASCQGRLCRIG